MKKEVLISIGLAIFLIILIVLMIVFIHHNIDNTSNPNKSSKINKLIKNTRTGEISQILLTEKDILGYRISSRAPRTRSDVSEGGLGLGWIEGYMLEFKKGETIFEMSIIEQLVSRYPLSTIDKVITNQIDDDDEWTAERLPNPNLGDKSVAYSYRNIEFGTRRYTIEFIKKDIYVFISIAGFETDYELLKELGKKIASRI